MLFYLLSLWFYTSDLVGEISSCTSPNSTNTLHWKPKIFYVNMSLPTSVYCKGICTFSLKIKWIGIFFFGNHVKMFRIPYILQNQSFTMMISFTVNTSIHEVSTGSDILCCCVSEGLSNWKFYVFLKPFWVWWELIKLFTFLPG